MKALRIVFTLLTASIVLTACTSDTSTNEGGETSYLKPTQAQLDWLEKYKEQMSPTQREMLDIE